MQKMTIFGEHTAAGIQGIRLSPYQILPANRLVPLDAIGVLGLRNVKRHDLERGGRLSGRTVLVEGDYHYRLENVCVGSSCGKNIDGVLRIGIYETQMSMGAAEIVVKELAEHAEKVRFYNGKDGMVQIRVGTALGVNAGERIWRLGDIAIATTSICFGGAILQSCGYAPPIDLSKVAKGDLAASKKFVRHLEAIGGSLTKDGKYLVFENNPQVADALSKVAHQAAGQSTRLGGACFSKDSLYGEDFGKMIDLGKKYGVTTSEMEQSMLAYISAEARYKYSLTIATGGIFVLVGDCWEDRAGRVHGQGYPNTGKEKKIVKNAMESAIRAAADALALIKEKISLP